MPLVWAVRNGHEGLVKLPLESGNVKVKVKDEDGNTPLGCAVESNDEVMLKLLVNHTDPDDEPGQLFSNATRARQESVMKALLDSGKVEPTQYGVENI